MDARPRPPLRLSVEERVDNAVKEAVRRALDVQRRTQERELDTLSDALQRSLAILAGERDRALRSLAAEEEKRQDIVEDLSRLLGDELTCADITRLMLGVDKVEQEGKDAGMGEDEREEEEPYGRTWVLEKLRQCLHARAAAQDCLRSAVQESAADLFEAEEFMTFEPGGLSGQAVQAVQAVHEMPIFPGGDGDGDCEGEGERRSPRGVAGEATAGVARARAAASEALRTSLRLARERVEYLEGLTSDVQGGGDGGDRSAVGETGARGGGGEGSAVAVDGEWLKQDRVGGGDGGGGRTGGDDHDGGGKDGSVDGYDEEEGFTTVKHERTEPAGESDDGVSGLPVDAKSVASVDEAAAAAPPPPPKTREQDEDATVKNGATSRAERQHAPARTEVVRRGGGGRVRVGSGKTSFSADAGVRATATATAAELGEVKRWRMASRRAEASLADLRETFGDALTLSFRCGEEHCRRQAAGAGSQSEAGSGGDGDASRGVELGVAGDKVDEEAAAVGPGAVGGEAMEAAVSEGNVGGTCWGKTMRCSSCEARATAVGVLLERLQALSAEQGRDIAQLETSLDNLRGSGGAPGAPRNAPKTAASREGWTELHAAQQCFKPPSTPTSDTTSVDGGSRRFGSEGVGSGAAVVGAEETVPALSSCSSAEAERGGDRGIGAAAAATEGLAAGGRGSRRTASYPKRDMRTEWEELEGLDTYLAHYRGGGGGLGSPEVQGVLDRWIDVSKRRILEGWLSHVLHGGPVDAANGRFVPRVQMSSLSKEVRDGLVSVVLPLLLARRGVLLQVLTRERVELVHDIQIRVTPVAGRRDAPANARAGNPGWRRAPVGEREHGARIRDMVMKAAHAGYVEEDEGRVIDAGMWRTPLASVDSLSRQLKDTWESFNANFAVMAEPREAGGNVWHQPEY